MIDLSNQFSLIQLKNVDLIGILQYSMVPGDRRQYRLFSCLHKNGSIELLIDPDAFRALQTVKFNSEVMSQEAQSTVRTLAALHWNDNVKTLLYYNFICHQIINTSSMNMRNLRRDKLTLRIKVVTGHCALLLIHNIYTSFELKPYIRKPYSCTSVLYANLILRYSPIIQKKYIGRFSVFLGFN